jgi:hypothetical protein
MPNEAWIAHIEASRHKAGTAWMVVNNYRKGDYAPYLFRTDDFGKSWDRVIDEDDVKGYTLSFIQDPVEPNLVFLGTENGLWISIDEGTTWTQFKNGFPSVSTMDLKIQETESALIVGTFGRAIWVLDDLLSLREIAGKRLKEGLTALPVNDAVQVKGLFINPPGNIWTGFHTTFEGANKVFQKTEIPFYLSDERKDGTSLKATVLDSQNRTVNTLTSDELQIGLNYLIWKLDESAASLPGAWKGDFSRDIPVLPGDYKIVLQYGSFEDSTQVRVIEDPRFDLDPEVDLALYNYRKEVDLQVVILARHLNDIDKKKSLVGKLQKQWDEDPSQPQDELKKQIDKMKDDLVALRAKGQTPRPDRQVGAWQSFETSPHSKLREAQSIGRAQTTEISPQHREVLEEASSLIADFSDQVDAFMKKDWTSFEKAVKKSDLQWPED